MAFLLRDQAGHSQQMALGQVGESLPQLGYHSGILTLHFHLRGLCRSPARSLIKKVELCVIRYFNVQNVICDFVSTHPHPTPYPH